MLRSCPGARALKDARPENVVCQHCRTEVEVWSDEVRARCPKCHAWVYLDQGVTCLDWCAQGERCVGSATFAAYKAARSRAT